MARRSRSRRKRAETRRGNSQKGTTCALPTVNKNGRVKKVTFKRRRGGGRGKGKNTQQATPSSSGASLQGMCQRCYRRLRSPPPENYPFPPFASLQLTDQTTETLLPPPHCSEAVFQQWCRRLLLPRPDRCYLQSNVTPFPPLFGVELPPFPPVSLQPPHHPPASSQLPSLPLVSSQPPCLPPVSSQLPCLPLVSSQQPPLFPVGSDLPPLPPESSQQPCQPPDSSQLPFLPPVSLQQPPPLPFSLYLPPLPPITSQQPPDSSQIPSLPSVSSQLSPPLPASSYLPPLLPVSSQPYPLPLVSSYLLPLPPLLSVSSQPPLPPPVSSQYPPSHHVAGSSQKGTTSMVPTTSKGGRVKKLAFKWRRDKNGCMKKVIFKRGRGRRRRKRKNVQKVTPSSSKKSTQEMFHQDDHSPSSSHVSSQLVDNTTETNPSLQSFSHRDRVVALDCEMVGVTKKKVSALARCSIVDYNGQTLFDEYVRPNDRITAYRTKWSGIKPYHMKNALPFNTAIQRIYDILQGKIVVGHDLSHDFSVLKCSHPLLDVRDTALYVPIRVAARLSPKLTPALKKVAARLLGRSIQKGCHDSVTDALAALDIYKMFEAQWEKKVEERKKQELEEEKIQEEEETEVKEEETEELKQEEMENHLLSDPYWPSELTSQAGLSSASCSS